MTFTEKANKIFNQAIRDYHLKDDVDTLKTDSTERRVRRLGDRPQIATRITNNLKK